MAERTGRPKPGGWLGVGCLSDIQATRSPPEACLPGELLPQCSVEQPQALPPAPALPPGPQHPTPGSRQHRLTTRASSSEQQGPRALLGQGSMARRAWPREFFQVLAGRGAGQCSRREEMAGGPRSLDSAVTLSPHRRLWSGQAPSPGGTGPSFSWGRDPHSASPALAWSGA